MKNLLILASIFGLATAAPLLGEAPRPNAPNMKSLIEIVARIEQTYDPIVEISFDDGAWEVEAFKGETAYELSVDPHSAEVTSEFRDYGETRPPSGSLRLSEIVSALAKADYVEIDEISFERRGWEVEAYRNGQKRELHVDAKTGEILSDRVDD